MLLPLCMLERFRIPLSWSELLKRTFNETLADDVFNLAAQQAYYFFFALFPALLALISIASFFPIENLIGEITAMLERVAPTDVTDIVTDQIVKIGQSNAGGLLTFAFLFTLWSSSSAVVSMCSTLNAAYDITEGRPWWKVRLIAIGLTLGLALFILVSMTLVVAGPTLAEKVAEAMRLGPAFTWTWKILQWPLVFALVATAVALVYYFAPDAEQDWVWITPGSVLATMLWVVASLGLPLLRDQLRQLQRDLRRDRRRHGAAALVLRLGDRAADRRGAECRDRARLAVRQGRRRKGAGREEEDRPGGRSAPTKNAAPGARSTCRPTRTTSTATSIGRSRSRRKCARATC